MFLLGARVALFHLVKLDSKQGKSRSASGRLRIWQRALQAGWLLCSRARPPPEEWQGHNPRSMVLLKGRQDQEREHKDARCFYIWVTGQVIERGQGEGSKLPQKYTEWILNDVLFLGGKRNVKPVCSPQRIKCELITLTGDQQLFFLFSVCPGWQHSLMNCWICQQRRTLYS